MQTSESYSVGILADDLTSAADGASPFVVRGLRTWIGRSEIPPRDGDVLAVDSGSRSMSVKQAAMRTAELISRLAPRRILYKTVDSTLRGHIAAELDAAFHASGRKRLVFAPAFAAAGRTTIGGVQHVNGIPVSRSDYGHDPVHPARTSVLADLVPGSIGDVVILDAATQEELDVQVAAMREPERVLWVGSPGMAQALAQRIAPTSGRSDGIAAGCGDILVAIGTANPISRRQADRIEEIRGVTLLRSPRDLQAYPHAVLARIAGEAARHLRTGSVHLLAATGGDTMEAILDRLDVQTFELIGEFDPGFPLGRVILADGRSLLIAMKAGGFGDNDTLRRAISRWRNNRPLSEQVLP